MTLSPTDKQKCIAEQAVYGDLLVGILIESSKGGVYCEFESNFLDLYGKDRDNYQTRKPILRPLSDLTAEITHKGYNEDKSFVPLVELKIIGKIGHRGLYYEDGSFYGERSTALARDGFTGTFVHWNIPHQQQLLDLLHLWHFDTRKLISTGEAIDINTLDINPYSVKL